MLLRSIPQHFKTQNWFAVALDFIRLTEARLVELDVAAAEGALPEPLPSPSPL